MSTSLDQFSDLVAETAMANALVIRDKFLQLLPMPISDNDRARLLTLLAFMNWTFASGIWSNLSNISLRRDLQIGLKNSLLLRLGSALTDLSSAEAIAARAVLLHGEFSEYLQAYKACLQTTHDADSRMATIFAFERIQEILSLSDDVMNSIVPSLVTVDGLAWPVESVANEVNKAVPY